MSAHVEHEEVDQVGVSVKRKRDLEDNGDREQKKVHVDDSTIDIGALHYDVGPKFLLLQNRKVPFSSIWSSCCGSSAVLQG